MTGRIISLHGDLHDDACALLPWYVTGRLDAEDIARVEAHLPDCAQCQADLAAERRLHAAIAGIDAPVGDVDAGFAALQAQLSPRSQPRRIRPAASRPPENRTGQEWRQSASWLRWAVAAQLALLILAGAALTLWHPAAAPSAQYRTLGAAPAPAEANIVVVFRPDIRESDLRRTLRDSQARLVGGPTAADAYLLHVDAAERALAVEHLRKQSTIVLAEPVDSGGKP